jgi:formylglycine-generating enzyme required for sulfatase activity
MTMTERRYGVLIASSRFPDEPKLEDLRCPENDVDGLNEVLRSPEHGQFSETFILKNKPHYEVLKNINQVLWQASKDDLVLIYYSGHGKLDFTGQLHLATIDTVVDLLVSTSIPVERIKSSIDNARSNKIILILDCCFSGEAEKAFAKIKSGVDDQLKLLSKARGTYILTASTGIQVAVEKESDEYGVFTKHIIEGIRSGEADIDSDGLVSMEDLYCYVRPRVLSEGFQEPMKCDLSVRGELIIALSGKASREEFTKSLGMEFVLIRAGTFLMGSPEGETGRYDNEKQHQVTLSQDFYLQTTPVTQGQWKKAMGWSPAFFKKCGEDCPVESVSWEDAQEFISKLNQKENTNKYHLPTEAEWEYACRAGSKGRFCFGDDEAKLEEYAWYVKNSNSKTHPVGQKKPNAWGLYDMHGNVWEWVQDWYGEYPAGPVTDPTGPASGERRVLRGGSWSYDAGRTRSAYRYYDNPDLRDDDFGFRVARAL